jgi:hypothetical protein
MSAELLSICIPTRNRAKYLREMLATFARQIANGKIGEDKVVFYISDNASDDGETPDIIREFEKKVPKAVCSRNAVNIGGDPNIIHVRTLAKGKYLWVLGDDELLCKGAVTTVLRLIEKHQPGLIIAYDSRYDLKISTPQVFSDYRAFAKECVRHNTHALAEHTLISCNIFRADCWDGEYAKSNLESTCFSHMFGMIRPLMQKKAGVVLPETPIITIRKLRPGPDNGYWADLNAEWLHYLTWLKDELQLPELDPTEPSRHARQAMICGMMKNPFLFLAGNWRSLFQPKAYQFVFNRLFRKNH